MQFDLTPEVAERIRAISASTGEQEIDVISRALDSLDAQERELRAIQQGINSWKAGRVRDFDEFDREFRTKRGLTAPDA